MGKISGITLGIYEKALPENVSWSERLTLAAEAGFDFVEMSLDPSVQRLERLTWSTAQRREVREIAHGLGIPMLTMCLSAHRQYPLGSADKIGRARGMEILQRALDLASARYDRGLTDFLNVIDAERQYYDLQEQYAEAQVAEGEQFVQLYKSLGGGWQNYQALPPIRLPQPAIIAALRRALGNAPR